MYDKIQAGLDVTLNSASLGVPIAWENVKYSPVTGTSFVRTRFMPIDRRQVSLGLDPVTSKPYQQKYQGIYQVIVNTPEDSGINPTNTIVKKIIDAFEAATDLSPQSGVYVRIFQTEKMRAYQESPWYKTPVNIHWYSYTQ